MFLLIFIFVISVSYGQKGIGEQTGIAAQDVKPQVIMVSGKLTEIIKEPFETNSGKSRVGIHLNIKNDEQKNLRLHLGPEHAVDHILELFKVGDNLSFEVFRTDNLPENQYIIKSLKLADKTIHIRDDNLKPSWANSKGNSKGGKGWGKGWRQQGPGN